MSIGDIIGIGILGVIFIAAMGGLGATLWFGSTRGFGPSAPPQPPPYPEFPYPDVLVYPPPGDSQAQAKLAAFQEQYYRDQEGVRRLGRDIDVDWLGHG